MTICYKACTHTEHAEDNEGLAPVKRPMWKVQVVTSFKIPYLCQKRKYSTKIVPTVTRSIIEQHLYKLFGVTQSGITSFFVSGYNNNRYESFVFSIVLYLN